MVLSFNIHKDSTVWLAEHFEGGQRTSTQTGTHLNQSVSFSSENKGLTFDFT